MRRVLIQLTVFALTLFVHVTGFACGDLDIICQQQEGKLNLPVPTPQIPIIIPPIVQILDPGCRGDICRGGQVITDETRRAINNLARELGKAPQAFEECLGDVPKCANEILSAPVALLAQAYIDGLYRQAEGKVHPFSPEFINLAQPYYDVDLRGVTFADNINTGHGMTLAYCDRIFFTHSGNLWTDINELHLVLHEIEHLVQCQKRGRRTFLAEYILKGAVDFANGRFNVHDVHDFEVAAEAKSNQLTDILWNKIHSGLVPVPGGNVAAPRFPSGYGMQVCGCWGFNPMPVLSEPRCASGAVRTNMCAGFCPGGGSPYAYVCQ